MQTLGRNIVVVGPSGSGKSTLAEELANRLGLRYVELDALHWEPGWQPADEDTFRARVAEAVKDDGWVVAGNYSAVRDLVWPRAHTIVWLDFSLPLVLRRLVARSWRRWRRKELLWGTNVERFWNQFLPGEESLLWYTSRHFADRRRVYEREALLKKVSRRANWVRLRSPEEAEGWLEGVCRRERARV